MWFKKDSENSRPVRAAFRAHSMAAREANARANAAALVNEGEGFFLNLYRHKETYLTDDAMYPELSSDLAEARSKRKKEMKKHNSESRLNPGQSAESTEKTSKIALLAKIGDLANDKHSLLGALGLVEEERKKLALLLGPVGFLSEYYHDLCTNVLK